MLGNGLCTRPVELDCRMESACETCTYFHTGTEFVPVLLRQRDHARDHDQPDRAALFDSLLTRSRDDPLDNDHPYNAGSVARFGVAGCLDDRHSVLCRCGRGKLNSA